jgi:hypothetical protein
MVMLCYAMVDRIPFFTSLQRLWWPINRIYVGRNLHEPEAYTYKYQVFWMILLAWKFLCRWLTCLVLINMPQTYGHIYNDMMMWYGMM